MKNSRIAFVHFPHYPNNARLETMPFALNSVNALAKAGWDVDLFLWEDPICNYDHVISKNVRIIYNKEVFSNDFYSKIICKIITEPRIWKYKFQNYKKYSCVFGLGQAGSYIASVIAEASKCPFIYLNDEFPSCWAESIWTELERKSAQKADLIVVPDKYRFSHLIKELKIPSKPHAMLPNIAINNEQLENIDWHQRLNIPKNHIPFLHAGSIGDWAQIPEILSSLPYWKKNTVLIIHSRSKDGVTAYRQQLSHLEVRNRVIWSFEPISEMELNSLVAYCVGNFALYRNTGPNFEYIGFSSGKLMRSLAYGSPVIASNFSSLRFIRDNELGILVDHPVEIPKAIEKISENRDFYSKRCIDFCQTKVSFEQSWIDLCKQFQNISKINLLNGST